MCVIWPWSNEETRLCLLTHTFFRPTFLAALGMVFVKSVSYKQVTADFGFLQPLCSINKPNEACKVCVYCTLAHYGHRV